MVWVCFCSDWQTAIERRTQGGTMQARLSVWIDMGDISGKPISRATFYRMWSERFEHVKVRKQES